MHTPRGTPARRRRNRHSRGQSLTEFALVLPVFLLIVLIGLDFGRVFLAWVELNNSVRIAANYAAQNPNSAWTGTYQTLVTNDWTGIDCDKPGTVPDPSFPGGKAIGQPAEVTITCHFHPFTPIISNIIGGSTGVAVTAFAAFPIRGGTIQGIPVQTVPPTPTPVPTPSPTPTPGPTASPTATPSQTPTPMCTVPQLTGLRTNRAQSTWGGAGFTTNVVFNPLIPPQYTIGKQSLSIGASYPCGTTAITVGP